MQPVEWRRHLRILFPFCLGPTGHSNKPGGHRAVGKCLCNYHPQEVGGNIENTDHLGKETVEMPSIDLACKWPGAVKQPQSSPIHFAKW